MVYKKLLSNTGFIQPIALVAVLVVVILVGVAGFYFGKNVNNSPATTSFNRSTPIASSSATPQASTMALPSTTDWKTFTESPDMNWTLPIGAAFKYPSNLKEIERIGGMNMSGYCIGDIDRSAIKFHLCIPYKDGITLTFIHQGRPSSAGPYGIPGPDIDGFVANMKVGETKSSKGIYGNEDSGQITRKTDIPITDGNALVYVYNYTGDDVTRYSQLVALITHKNKPRYEVSIQVGNKDIKKLESNEPLLRQFVQNIKLP